MNWYLKAFRQYADFQGRARRKEYWMFTLFHLIAAIIASGMDALMNSYVFYLAYVLVSFIPALAVMVRRLHDIGKSGWMVFVSCVPFIGGLWLLALLLGEGDTGENIYGPDPKADPNYDIIEEIGMSQG